MFVSPCCSLFCKEVCSMEQKHFAEDMGKVSGIWHDISCAI